MISRTWHGCVPMKHKQGFYDYELITGVEETRNTEGNLNTYLKVVDQEEYCHFFLCSIWENMDSVKKFAGNNPEIAVTYPEDEKFELISDPLVILQEVTSAKNPFEYRQEKS
ncbi:hypothetical protein IGL98_000376 [Enterococcus sp. DIV0840]|uniref:hypothetical protein n=1 Tax=Enterococcus TaxID=1350 RepID=UPI000A354E2F|nr:MULTISPECIES: hypothetical protein [Enterococcus]MBO0435664.1 hypothetical protein [Enterococcus sp. DIV0849a]MBO0475330.1 hypothetical protein [Enterococcus ureasiticus]OTN87593.1 hypothetical protein A5819_000039 [Enterococcus sp. 7E2_DIV0204]OTP49721.1 hypothetical protein A5884_002921 [Enterococcus sp. 7D2_DIV0200]